MQINYYPESDSLYIALSSAKGADALVVSEDVVMDVDAAGGVVGFDIQHASRRADLSSFGVQSIPVAQKSA